MSDKLNENSVNETEELLEKETELEAAENAAKVEETEEAAEEVTEEVTEQAADEAEGDGVEINAEAPKLEENDNWEFEAKAHTLDDTLIENDEMIIEIPKKEMTYETRERPKAQAQETKEAPSKPARDNRNATIFLLVAIFGVIIIGALTFLGIRYYTVPATIGATETHEVTNPGNVALTVNGTKVTAGLYSYYYNQIVTSYASQAQQGYTEFDVTKDFSKQKTKDDDGKEITWEAKLKKETETWIQQLMAYYSKGVEEGMTLSAEDKKDIDEEVKNLKDTAKQSGLSLQEYITTTYGDYVTLATLRNSSEYYVIARNYARKMATELRPTVEEAQKYYEKNKDDFLQVKFSWLPMIYNEKNKDAVIKQAQKYANKIKTSDDLKKYIPKACKDLIDEYVESGQFGDADAVAEQIAETTEATTTKDNPNQYPQEIIDFLFDDKNAVGTCTTVADDEYQAVYIILKEGTPAPVEDETYSVRHILISPGEDKEEDESEDAPDVEGEEEEEKENSEPTKEEWDAAEQKANDIYTEFNQTDKSEYQFALLAEKYSSDPGSISSGGQGSYGGLYYKQSLGTMVEEFEKWATDPAREYGDTEIIKTRYGYHIMYFVDDQPDYLMDCLTAASMEMEDKFIESFEVKEHKGVLNRVIEAVNTKVKKDMKANASAQKAADDEAVNYGEANEDAENEGVLEDGDEAVAAEGDDEIVPEVEIESED